MKGGEIFKVVRTMPGTEHSGTPRSLSPIRVELGGAARRGFRRRTFGGQNVAVPWWRVGCARGDEEVGPREVQDLPRAAQHRQLLPRRLRRALSDGVQ